MTEPRDGVMRTMIESMVSRHATVSIDRVGQCLFPAETRLIDRIQDLREDDHLLGFRLGSRDQFPAFQFDWERRCIKEMVVYANRKLGVSRDPYGSLAWWETPIRMANEMTPLQLLSKNDLNQTLIDNVFASYRAGM